MKKEEVKVVLQFAYIKSTASEMYTASLLFISNAGYGITEVFLNTTQSGCSSIKSSI